MHALDRRVRSKKQAQRQTDLQDHPSSHVYGHVLHVNGNESANGNGSHLSCCHVHDGGGDEIYHPLDGDDDGVLLRALLGQ